MRGPTSQRVITVTDTYFQLLANDLQPRGSPLNTSFRCQIRYSLLGSAAIRAGFSKKVPCRGIK